MQREAISFFKTVRFGDRVDWDRICQYQIALSNLIEQHEIKIKQLEDQLDQLKLDNGL